MTTPYYQDAKVTLYHGDCRELLPNLNLDAVAAVCDPPYGETTAPWDRWPTGWVEAVTAVPTITSLWCFGSMRLHLERSQEFYRAGWKFGQDQWSDLTDLLLWEKRNGSGPGSRDRLTKVHETAVHWYRGKWSDGHHEWERDINLGPGKGVIRRPAPAAQHQRMRRATVYKDDGTRQPRSVQHLQVPSVRYMRRHQDEKPLGVVVPLVRESTPEGETVLDPTAGTGTVGVVARMLGRNAVLIESDEATCEIAATRLAEDCAGQLDLGAELATT